MQHAAISALLRSGTDVVVDDTNLDPRYYPALVRVCERAGARVEWVDLTGVPLEVCVERDGLRGADRVGEDVIRGIHARFLCSTC